MLKKNSGLTFWWGFFSFQDLKVSGYFYLPLLLTITMAVKSGCLNSIFHNFQYCNHSVNFIKDNWLKMWLRDPEITYKNKSIMNSSTYVQTHHVYSTLKRRGNVQEEKTFLVVSNSSAVILILQPWQLLMWISNQKLLDFNSLYGTCGKNFSTISWKLWALVRMRVLNN